MKKFFLSFLMMGLIIGISACGSSGSSTNAADADFTSPPVTIDPAALGTAANLNYLFEIQIDADGSGLDFAIPYPDTYKAPFYFQSDGTVSLISNEFPSMIFRVCDTDSETSGCMAYQDDLSTDLDLVIDSCGANVDDDGCGSADTTVFTGTLSESGDMTINAASIRVRLFVATATPNGYTAKSTDTGLINLERMVAKITTSTVTSGALNKSGSRVSHSNVKLVAAGSVPDEIPTLGGAHYAASITGTFDTDPLSLLE